MSEEEKKEEETIVVENVQEVNVKLADDAENPLNMTEEQREKQVLDKVKAVLKMKDKEFREAIVRDYNTMGVLVFATHRILGVGNKNFVEIAKFINNAVKRFEADEARITELEQKLAFLEQVAKNGARKTEKYLQ